jgi:ATP-binding cassette subfamily B protein
VRVFGFADWALERIHGHVVRMFSPTWDVARRAIRRQTTRVLIAFAGLGAVFTAVAVGAAHGGPTVAVEAAVFSAAWSLCNGLVGYDVRNLVGALPVLEATEELEACLAAPPPPLPEPRREEHAHPPLVRFEKVSFRYPGSERDVLDGVDLEIRPGELLAVVGLNGAGKSTLIKLLAALYQPTGGRITADGTDIADVGPSAWRRRLSVVFQDFVRYQLSLADNVTLGQADGVPADLDLARLAAEDAGMNEVLSRLPEGWNTPLARRVPGAWTCRAASGSRWSWPGRCTRCGPEPGCWCSTSRRPTSTCAPSSRSSPAWPSTAVTAASC